MSKERLEKAKKILNHIKGYGVYDGNDDIEIFEWLIEQAEQKQSLETTVDFYQSALRDADRRVQELENVNRVLKKANVGSERAKERLRKWIDELEIENEHYREALEFYAEPKNWLPQNEDVLSLITMDYGEKARGTLEGEE